MTYRLVGSLSSRAFRVAWAFEELGLDYALEPAEPQSDAAFALNPSGKVPALVVGDGTVLTDSVAITQFLADRHGGLTHPAGSLARGQQDGMTQLLLDEMEGPLWIVARHRFILPPQERVPAIRGTARADFGRAMAVLEARLGGRAYLAGEAPTVPDLIFGHCAYWARAAKFAIPDGPLADLAARLHDRPAYRRLVERRDRKG